MIIINLEIKEWSQKDYENLNKELNAISQKDYKEFSSKLIPGCDNILGIRIPILRDMAKQIAKGNWRSFVSGVQSTYFECDMLHGLVLGYAKAECGEILKYLEAFVPKINNWSVCDSTSAGLKFTSKNREEVLQFLNKYINSDKEFELRFVLVILMDYYITDEYIDTVLKITASINHSGYYVKMAVAWLISVSFVKYREKTEKLLNSGCLDAFTYDKALQKIVESFRVDEKTKEDIRKIRKQNKGARND